MGPFVYGAGLRGGVVGSGGGGAGGGRRGGRGLCWLRVGLKGPNT